MAREPRNVLISEEWQRAVDSRIEDMKKREPGFSQNELARRAKISGSTITEALKPGAVEVSLRVMIAINSVLGLPLPPDAMTPEEMEFVQFIRGLDPEGRGTMRERARMEAERALERQRPPRKRR